MSVVDNLIQINECKGNIKSALINKGVDMTDVPFTEYANKISSIVVDESSEAPDNGVYFYSNGVMDDDPNKLSNDASILKKYAIESDVYEFIFFTVEEWACLAGTYDNTRFAPFIMYIPNGYTLTSVYKYDVLNDKWCDNPYTLGVEDPNIDTVIKSLVLGDSNYHIYIMNSEVFDENTTNHESIKVKISKNN